MDDDLNFQIETTEAPEAIEVVDVIISAARPLTSCGHDHTYSLLGLITTDGSVLNVAIPSGSPLFGLLVSGKLGELARETLVKLETSDL